MLVEEIWVKNILLAFDGRVVEVFGFASSESIRFHIANLSVNVDDPDRKGRRMVQLKPATRGGGCAFQVETQEWAELAPFLDNITRAMPPPR